MSEIGSVYLLEILKGFKGLKSNAEKAIEQLSDEELHYTPDPETNSTTIIVKHIAGNLYSRFTDFLISDGEKPNRNRDNEFIDEQWSRIQLMEYWEGGWQILFSTLQQLTEDDLTKTVYIRSEAHTVIRALQRQLAHYAYHCGQIVFLAKLIKSDRFKNLSIPRGKSNEFLSSPPKEK